MSETEDQINGQRQATLFVVATPIGNLEDITVRALRVLKEVDLIACEDTRMTKRLLQHYSIETKTLSYSADTDKNSDKIIQLLQEGKKIALVTDAGTPGISDPGSFLVLKVREQTEAQVITIPGPSALTASLSIAGMPGSDFIFLGFLPHKKGRETLFKEIAASERTSVFYESPHRILKSLESLKIFIENERIICVCRELTKIYEEVVKGSSEEVFLYFTENTEKVRGEFVVIVGGK